MTDAYRQSGPVVRLRTNAAFVPRNRRGSLQSTDPPSRSNPSSMRPGTHGRSNRRSGMKIDTDKVQELARADQALIRAADRLLDQAERVLQLRSVYADSSDAFILLQNMRQGLVALYALRRVIKREVRGDDFAYPLLQPRRSNADRGTTRLLLRRAMYRPTGDVLRLLKRKDWARA
jgi:hypothetical protein